jgi:hypothetical protein
MAGVGGVEVRNRSILPSKALQGCAPGCVRHRNGTDLGCIGPRRSSQNRTKSTSTFFRFFRVLQVAGVGGVEVRNRSILPSKALQGCAPGRVRHRNGTDLGWIGPRPYNTIFFFSLHKINFKFQKKKKVRVEFFFFFVLFVCPPL